MKKSILFLLLSSQLLFAKNISTNNYCFSVSHSLQKISVDAETNLNPKLPTVFVKSISQSVFNKNNNISNAIKSLTEISADEPLFANEQISISSIFPNPATTVASIKYNMNSAVDAKIVLCNVLGSVLGEYRLVKDANQLNIATSELTPGVYFYTLSINGSSMVTKKVIVKRS
jgi:hypothetical protein